MKQMKRIHHLGKVNNVDGEVVREEAPNSWYIRVQFTVYNSRQT